MGVVDRPVRRVLLHPHPPKLKVVPDTVLRVDNKSGEVRTQTYSGVSVRGLQIPPRFSPCKTHSERWLNLQDLILRLTSKHVFDCKMFDVANWVTHLNGEDLPGGTPSHETLSVSPQGALEISLFYRHPPYLVRDHFSSPRVVAKSRKRYEGHRPSPQDHSI